MAAASDCPAGMSYHVGGSYTQTQNDLTPIRYKGSNNCYDGTSVKGTFDTSTKWWQMKQCCNGGAITVDSGPTALVNSYTYNAGVDGIRTWNGAAVTLVGVHESYTRDDCISDITHGDLIIRDSLFDGCHTGISWRSDNNSNKKAFKVDIQDSMFYVQPEPGSKSGGSCTQWVVNGKANGPMWKMDSVQSGVNLKNVTIRQDLGNHECKDVWPSGTYNNVTFVWTGSGNYPGKLPAGVTMTRDVNVWNNAKSAWLSHHSAASAAAAPQVQSAVAATTTGHVSKVLTIWLENHSESQAMSTMPYLASMSKTYGYTKAYKAITHPSLPNYLAFAAGSTLGVTDDNPPSSHHLTGSTLFSQAIKAGRTAKTYAENMMTTGGTPKNCVNVDVTNPPGYEVHHNPWTYFTDDTTHCNAFDVPFPGHTSGGATIGGSLSTDVAGGLPDFSWVVPNECNDGHDCGLSVADNWLKAWLPVIMRGPDYQAGRLAVVITSDEDDRKSGNVVLTTVVSPYTHGIVCSTAFTHYSLTRLVDEVLGLPLLRNAAKANDMRPAFHL